MTTPGVLYPRDNKLYHKSQIVVFIIFVVMSVLVTVAAVLYSALLFMFALLLYMFALYMMIAIYNSGEHIIVSSEGIEIRSTRNARKYIDWDDVQSIRTKPGLIAFKLDQGGVFRIRIVGNYRLYISDIVKSFPSHIERSVNLSMINADEYKHSVEYKSVLRYDIYSHMLMALYLSVIIMAGYVNRTIPEYDSDTYYQYWMNVGPVIAGYILIFIKLRRGINKVLTKDPKIWVPISKNI